MQRILLFLLTNIAIMVILSITLRILGVDSLLMQNGSDLNINSLVIFSGVFGFGGAFISLAISKWMAKRMTGKFITDGLNGITEVWGLEVGLILDDLYAGTADCVGTYNGVPSLIDFKTAKKIKRRDWIEDYFLQGSAYANAHNVMFGTDIQQIVILMVDRDLIFQEFLVKPAEFNVITGKWKRRLIDFDKKYNKN